MSLVRTVLAYQRFYWQFMGAKLYLLVMVMLFLMKQVDIYYMMRLLLLVLVRCCKWFRGILQRLSHQRLHHM